MIIGEVCMRPMDESRVALSSFPGFDHCTCVTLTSGKCEQKVYKNSLYYFCALFKYKIILKHIFNVSKLKCR